MNGKVAIFDPFSGGHHSEYLYYVIENWLSEYPGFHLDVVTTQVNLNQHPDLYEWQRIKIEGINFYVIPELSKESLIRKSFEQAKTLTQYINDNNPSHVLCMAFDWLQIPMTTRLRFGYTLKISGIYFRPTWHYIKWQKLNLKDYIRSIRQYIILQLALTNPHIDSLLCLDPFCANILATKKKNCKIIYLPDPVEKNETDTSFKLHSKFDVQDGRMIFLHMGYLDARKGVVEFINAINLLPVDVLKKSFFLFAGKLSEDIVQNVNNMINALPQEAAVHITNSFIPYHTFQAYIEQSDVVVLTYQNHIGSSGLLLRAALAKKRVICQDFGLMGYLVKKHNLGEVVNSFVPAEIAKGIIKTIYTEKSKDYNADFVQEHTVQAFQKTIKDTLLG
ncbi:MAG: glycosyltransferase [Bacteroidetes Order II. Incertae sedis bacterium]|nr:glycosyltransferase [Bacteroidetes Order II. bacterium]